MVTHKLMLDERRVKQDGTYPLIIRITYLRQTLIIQTGVSIKKIHWNDKSSNVTDGHPDCSMFNMKVSEQYLKVKKVILLLELEQEFSLIALKERLANPHKQAKRLATKTFKDYAQQLIDELIDLNKAGNAMVYKVAVSRFNKYVKNPKLKFTDINYNLLDGFKRQLMKDGVKQNTISNYFRTLRAIYNKAIKAKLVDRSHYPFLDIPIKTERTAKRAISIDDLVTILQKVLKPQSQEWHSRNYFFLSFSLIGMSFTDLAYLTSGNIKKGRLTYKRRKTGKELSIRLHPYAESLLSYYKGSNVKYLLPILPSDIIEDGMKAKSLLMSKIKQVNMYLKRIVESCELDCEVTTYVARHSWATTAKQQDYQHLS
jgi:integrase/recombinase XerD